MFQPVFRLLKEVDYYQREAQENAGKLQRMKDEGQDVYDIKKFEEVLGESLMMIPDSERRLKESLENLGLFLDTNDSLSDSECLRQARELLHNASEEEIIEETQVDDNADAF